jgi:hypothetical protein
MAMHAEPDLGPMRNCHIGVILGINNSYSKSLT